MVMDGKGPDGVAPLPVRLARSLVAPVGDAYLTLRYLVKAARLRRRTEGVTDHGALFDAVSGFREFRPVQVRSEFLRLMERLGRRPPRAICEIGMAKGGTAFLFARVAAPDARIVTIDKGLHPPRAAAVRRFALKGQRIHCLHGDSHLEATLHRAQELAGTRCFDFLFIDGDHSYDGVRRDFELFSPWVEPEGVIAFHDIVLDFRTRHGRKTRTYTGGAPRFWEELKARSPGAEDFVENPEQDGFGIGLIPRAGGEGA